MISLQATATFSAAHFYHQKAWSTERNQETFGACFSTYGHGHDYVVQAWMATEPSRSETDLQKLEVALRKVCSAWDHRHLNFDIEDFRVRIPTTEEIAQVLWSKLIKESSGLSFLRLRVFERPDLWAELERTS